MLFEPLKRMLNNVIALDENALINEILSDKKFQEFILDLNKGQLELGINSLGVQLSKIGGEYSELTLQIAAEEGRPKKSAKQVDLHDTGDYYDSFKVSLSNVSLTIDSDPIKDGKSLEKRWGKDLEGLTDENLQIVIDAIRKKIVPIVRERIAA